MKSKDQEYKEIFIAEAIQNISELNKYITQLEKNKDDKKALDAVFRITHTLKGNAGGLGFSDIQEFAHTTEDFLGEIRNGTISLDQDVFNLIFKAVDTISNMVDALTTDQKVRYLGLKTRIEVLLDSSKKPACEEGEQESKTQEEISEEPLSEENTSPDGTTEIAATESGAQEEVEVETDGLQSKISFSNLVQVPVKKLDQLLDLVGELIIEKDRIIASQPELASSNEYSMLSRIASELQYSAMDVRLVQVGFLFNKFHRVVRDAASVEGKSVSLKLEGTSTEIDRNILQIISDSLIHLIRNAIGHGIESREDRLQQGKREEGTVTLSASAESEGVIMKIIDDGKGIDVSQIKAKAIQKQLVDENTANTLSDSEIISFIFEPGFSTVEQVNAISGRGVGMDVVKNAVESVGGSIFVESEIGKGSTFTLSLPSSMAVKNTLLFALDNTEYAIPLNYTEAVISVPKQSLKWVNKGLAMTYSDKTISVLFLKSIFNPELEENTPKKLLDKYDEDSKINMVIVSHNNRMVGIVVDVLRQRKEIIEKPLARPLEHVKYISGVTILGNGHVCLVLNTPAIVNSLFKMGRKNQNKEHASPN